MIQTIFSICYKTLVLFLLTVIFKIVVFGKFFDFWFYIFMALGIGIGSEWNNLKKNL